MDRIPDRHRAQRPITGDRPQTAKVRIGPEHPACVRQSGVPGRLAGAGEHVRLGIHADDQPHTTGQRQGKLPRAASQIQGEIRRRKRQTVSQRADQRVRVSPPVPGVVTGSLPAEFACHHSMIPPADSNRRTATTKSSPLARTPCPAPPATPGTHTGDTETRSARIKDPITAGTNKRHLQRKRAFSPHRFHAYSSLSHKRREDPRA